jgi:hypothetical protein
MTKQQKLDTLSRRIRAHCPELMELTFGCEVKDASSVSWRVSDRVPHEDALYIVNVVRGVVVQTWHIEWLRKHGTIVGHPVQLQHVLHAAYESDNMDFRIGPSGDILDLNNDRRAKYDLTLPFEQQEEPVHDFLLEVIT